MRFFILVLLLTVTSQIHAQKLKAVKVLGPETFYLNSAGNMTRMKTRDVKSFVLPPNTVKWYYTFSASRNMEDIQRAQSTFSLFSKLSYAIDMSGTSSSVLSLIGQPPGSNYCDVYRLHPNSVRAFESKSSFQPIREGTRENLMSGTVEVPSNGSSWQYLGFRNNDLTYGINITIEVVAIVKEEATTNGWTKEQKDELYRGFKKEFKRSDARNYLSDEEADKLIVCIIKKILSEYSPEQIQSFAEYEFKEIFIQLAKNCDAELGLKIEEKK